GALLPGGLGRGGPPRGGQKMRPRLCGGGPAPPVGPQRWRRPVAVGTGVAPRPPHRPQRAGLPHWVPALGASVRALFRIWMLDSDGRQPPLPDAAHAVPVQPLTLATTTERREPEPSRLDAEGPECVGVAGHRVVGEVPT